MFGARREMLQAAHGGRGPHRSGRTVARFSGRLAPPTAAPGPRPHRRLLPQHLPRPGQRARPPSRPPRSWTSAPVRGLIDWELSTLGPAFIDLSYWCAMLRMDASWPIGGLGSFNRSSLGIPDEVRPATLPGTKIYWAF